MASFTMEYELLINSTPSSTILNVEFCILSLKQLK